MPIRKFRDVSEMEGNTWHEPGSPELSRAIRIACGRTLRDPAVNGQYATK